MPQWRGAQSVVWMSFHLTTHPVRWWQHFKTSILRTVVSCLACLPSCLTSRLPGVYLWHKDGALLMPRDCQHTHHNLLHLWELSENKGLDVTVTEPSAWTGTHAGAFFSPCYCNTDMYKSSVSAVRTCLWIDPSVCGVFTCTNSFFFLKRARWSLAWQNFVLWSKNRYPWCYFVFFFSVCVNSYY